MEIRYGRRCSFYFSVKPAVSCWHSRCFLIRLFFEPTQLSKNGNVKQKEEYYDAGI